MQERIQKRIWNINCDSQVLLKYIAVFREIYSRLLIKVCVRTIFEALRRRSPDNGFLVKTVLLNLACGRRPILTLRSLSQSNTIANLYINI